MTPRQTKSARAVAADVLKQFDPGRNFAAPLLDKLLPQTDRPQHATDLVFGTIRNRIAIDHVIAQITERPTERIPAKLLNIIRIGTYELIYVPQTPQYSIVNEAAENAKAIAGKKQIGFVNAALRRISRQITNRQIPLSQAAVTKTIPQIPTTGCEFETELLPNPADSPAEHLSKAFSLPKWLIEDWLTDFEAKKTAQLCVASNRRPGVYIRPNRLKTTPEHLAEKLSQADIEFEILPDQQMLRVKSPRAIANLPGFKQGLFTVQDLTASQPVKALKPQPNWTILDLCAAPGTKTTQLAELTGDKAKITATDISAQRLEKLTENITRLDIHSINIVDYENVQQSGPFDAVLLDVPCSNTGVLAKRIEARYRVTPNALKKLTKTQSSLLDRAAELTKPAGKICYSTCTIQNAENNKLIENFLKNNPAFTLKSEKLTLPSPEKPDHDGGYLAILEKK